MDIQSSGGGEVDPLERALFRYRDPSPNEVAKALGVSGQHIKDLCRELGLMMVNKAQPGAAYPRWRIPLRTFQALRASLGERHSR